MATHALDDPHHPKGCIQAYVVVSAGSASPAVMLGIQASASLIALFGVLVPIAILLLLGTLLLNGSRTNVPYLRERNFAVCIRRVCLDVTTLKKPKAVRRRRKTGE